MAIYVPTEFFEQINKMLFLPQCDNTIDNIYVFQYFQCFFKNFPHCVDCMLHKERTQVMHFCTQHDSICTVIYYFCRFDKEKIVLFYRVFLKKNCQKNIHSSLLCIRIVRRVSIVIEMKFETNFFGLRSYLSTKHTFETTL